MIWPAQGELEILDGYLDEPADEYRRRYTDNEEVDEDAETD